MNVKFAAAIAFFGALGWFSGRAAADTTKDCHVGSYRLIDGRTVDIAPYDDNTLRWLMFTGERGQLHPHKNGTWSSTYGWTDRPDGNTVSFSDCEKGEIIFAKEA